MTFEVENYRCQCGADIKIPIRECYTNPLYVWEVERQNKYVLKVLQKMQGDVMRLAGECLEAGVEPTIMREFNEMMALFNDLKRRFGIEKQ
jgi:hypothetical protein